MKLSLALFLTSCVVLSACADRQAVAPVVVYNEVPAGLLSCKPKPVEPVYICSVEGLNIGQDRKCTIEETTEDFKAFARYHANLEISDSDCRDKLNDCRELLNKKKAP